jgi:hypothetical protein
MQADLFTRLGRTSVPIHAARDYAAQELGLETSRDALEMEMVLKRPLRPDQVSLEYKELQRLFVSLVLRLDLKVLEDLRSGTLLAFGIRLPLRPSSKSEPIPSGLWYLMSFDMEDCTAAGPQWSYRDVRIICVRSMGAPERREVDRGLVILAAQLEAEEAAMALPEPTKRATYAPSQKKHAVIDVPGSLPEIGAATGDISIKLRVADDPLDRHVSTPEKDVVDPPPSQMGPWSVMDKIEGELRRRAAAGECKQTWPEESNSLWHWAKRKFKRNEQTKTADPPGLKWIREKLGDLYYELNPQSRRRRRRRQKSETPADSSAMG